MLTVVNHNTRIPGYSSLRAMPISGTVTIEVLANGKSVDTTSVSRNGDWLKSFTLEDGEYTLRFSGFFYPIGKGSNSRYMYNERRRIDIALSIDTPKQPTLITSLADVKNV